MSFANPIKTIPESGQLVSLRGRRFCVTDVCASTSSINLVRSRQTTNHHLVKVKSVEDDDLGAELEVIWELEIDAATYETRELPYLEGFDPAERLEAFLDAVRWGAASSADVRNIQSPFRSGIDIEDYQLDPVVRAIQMPRVSLLIADDVGLGKTIEAGLVAQEMILRQRVQKILVVCPSSLQVQWQQQMRDKFGLDFRIVSSELMKQLRRNRGIHVNPWTHYPRLITSIDFLKRDRPLRLMREVLPKEGESIYPRRFDLLIVDEAHNVAPSGSGNYAIDSQRTAAIRLLAPHFEHKMFLTATPHNGYPESFTTLLELLDSQRFARGVTPERSQLEVVMVRRLKRELPPKWDGTPRFAQRQLEAIAVDYTPEEKAVNWMLGEYTQLRRKNAQDNVELYSTEFVLKLLKKRLFSSPAAFLTTLEKHSESIESKRRKSKTSLRESNLGILRRQLEGLEEDFADDMAYEESTDSAIDLTSRLFSELNSEEKQLLEQMLDWAETAERNPDSKAQQLLAWLEEVIRPNGKWSNQRVIIFTEYRATQKWLYDLLANRGFAKDNRLMTMYGGINPVDREKVKAAFQANPEVSNVRILLATDAASEGLDLQNYCSNLIHYEIPWNPNRMEQRNGRIDRHGQKASEVKIYHFVGKNYAQSNTQGVAPGELEGDLEFLMRAALKVNNIREDLGKVGSVIATQVEEAMLGKRTSLDTQQAEEQGVAVRRMLKFERQINDRIAQLKEHLDETRTTLRLEPQNIETVVKIGLELAGQQPLQPVPDTTGIYYLPAFKGSWVKCTDGLPDPHTGEIRAVTFNPDLTRGREDLVLIHLNHPLVQMCLRLLRAEVWSRGSQKNLHRVTAKIVPNSVLEFPSVIAYGRLLILGNDSQKLHEEVITAGGVLKEGRFSRLNVLKIREALAASYSGEIKDSTKESLVKLWDSYEESLLNSLEKRASERTQASEKSLQKRCDKEVADLTAVLTELQRSIEQELAEFAQPLQLKLDLFNDVEQQQLESNRNSLKARLEDIPQEIEQETKLIKDRFANLSSRLFPLAIAFLIPQKYA